MMKGLLRTEYFPEEVVRDAVGGCCHDFALALHRRTGWPVAAVWKDPVGDGHDISMDPRPVHVFCVEPGGRAVDAEGVADLEAARKAYCGHSPDIWRYRIEVHGDEAAWEAVTADGEAAALAPRERGIAGAGSVMDASEAFLALIDRLAAGCAPPR